MIVLKDGFTALHIAAKNGQTKAIGELLAHGAGTNIQAEVWFVNETS